MNKVEILANHIRGLRNAAQTMRGVTFSAKACANLANELEAVSVELAELIEAMKLIDHESEHRFTGCEPGPMKRMPPKLKAAIIAAREVLVRVGSAS